jgi:streptogramin lyase
LLPELVFGVASVIALVVTGCGDDAGVMGTDSDTTPPAAVQDLSVAIPSESSVVLTWTAPGDDGLDGTASEYEVRYSQEPLTEESFPVSGIKVTSPQPHVAGTQETAVISQLPGSAGYCFGVKAVDEAGNWSELSNIACTLPDADVIAPGSVSDLEVATVDYRTLIITWTSTGDDELEGTAAEYDVRYSTEPLGLVTPGGWDASNRVLPVPVPGRSGAKETLEVMGLSNETTYYLGIAVMDESGNVSGLSNIATATTLGPPKFLLEWGSGPGSADGEFSGPVSVAVDASGNVYVSDQGNHRIQKFDSDGNLLTKWGSQGSADGQFNRPWGIAVDSRGDIYVADDLNHRVQKFNGDGTFLTKWGSPGSGDGQFDRPTDIAVDASGNVFVADSKNIRIQKFDRDGAFSTKWGSEGSGDGQFSAGEKFVAVDPSGNVYVSEHFGYRVQKFDGDGTFLTKWGSGAFGGDDGEFDGSNGVAVDATGCVYVADQFNDRIQKFDENGVFLTKWGSGAPSEFIWPQDVTVDANGDVYVTDTFHHRIQKFREP